MLSKRVIACLDVRDGKLAKSVKFVDTKDIGDPVEKAKQYYEDGLDELVFYDITASSEKRNIILDVVEHVAAQIFIPFSVGGGVRSVEDVRRLLNAGADKVSINTAAVQDPGLVLDACSRFGSQCIVVAIDAKRCAGTAVRWEVFTHGGRRATGLDALEWGKRMQGAGAGEILLTSMDRDGTRQGFDLELTRAFSDALEIPIIASGGVGWRRALYWRRRGRLDQLHRVLALLLDVVELLSGNGDFQLAHADLVRHGAHHKVGTVGVAVP